MGLHWPHLQNPNIPSVFRLDAAEHGNPLKPEPTANENAAQQPPSLSAPDQVGSKTATEPTDAGPMGEGDFSQPSAADQQLPTTSIQTNATAGAEQAQGQAAPKGEAVLQALGDDPDAEDVFKPLKDIPVPEGNWAPLPTFQFHAPAMYGTIGTLNSEPCPNPRASWLAGQAVAHAQPVSV